MNHDAVCTLSTYFDVPADKIEDFKALGRRFIERSRGEPGCVHLAFSFSNFTAHCREGYDDADALLNHLDNVSTLFQEALAIAYLIKLEVHAPALEIEKMRLALATLKPQYFTLEAGGLRR
jgi:quinol monooxygenase YgiN